ncbi:hypothetical protein EUGRSUZ_B00804 [Eucalyptus grandis]|uniref:Uncharacterized protein n=2 Tax=Eucalyptus grandis TaxID=71139 RepID=A0ACC3LP70_EUCGR|nr:hypothetical protein EUGRSUZ_B00804 [Eucalyptus grandis]
MSCFSLSLFIFSLHIHYLVPTSGEFQQFRECASFVCGDQEISYPFRHVRQPSYCGYPGYELDCDRDNLTILSMKSLEYQVIHMDRSKQILEVERMDLSNDICLGTHVDTTLNFSLFNYTSSYLNSTLFYNCNSSSTHSPYRFSCPASGHGYFALDADLEKLPHERCNFSVFVPILPIEASSPPSTPESGSSANIRDIIRDILKKGFEITWIANTFLCENCTKSGGRCGYGWTGQEFNCFCRDKACPTTCSGPSGMYAKVTVA